MNDEPKDDDAGQRAYGVSKPVGHVLISFPSEDQARAAMVAMTEAGVAASDLAYYAPAEVERQTADDIAHAGLLASLGQELNLVRAQNALAARGYSFVSVHAPGDDAARRAADIAARFGAERAQHYGRFVIEELIEPGTGEAQTAESPDRGLDAQTRSGVEGDDDRR